MRKEVLRTFCHSLHIKQVGIAPVGPYVELEEIIEIRRQKGQYTEFEEEDIRKRIDPRLTMEEVQSVIVCLFPYHRGNENKSNLASYSQSVDYHILAKEKLEEIGYFCAGEIPGFVYKAFVDTGPLVDRYMAYLAGLGFYGQNHHLINDEYGSYVVIGYLLTNYPFPADQPLTTSCMQCGRCITACPGQVLFPDFTMDPRGCRSYLTQKKGELTPKEIQILQKNQLVFGCDVCQDVCPHNQGLSTTPLEEFRKDLFPNLDYEEILSISNKEFMRRYGKRAFSWRGRKLLVRNFEYLLES